MPSSSKQNTQRRDYGLINAVWSALVAGLLAAAKARDRDAPPVAATWRGQARDAEGSRAGNS